jgi:hypothetical protein
VDEQFGRVALVSGELQPVGFGQFALARPVRRSRHDRRGSFPNQPEILEYASRSARDYGERKTQ